jgi:hypothetical protein
MEIAKYSILWGAKTVKTVFEKDLTDAPVGSAAIDCLQVITHRGRGRAITTLTWGDQVEEKEGALRRG